MNSNGEEPVKTGSFQSHHDNALQYLAKGQFGRASLECKAATKLKPDDPGILNVQGQISLAQGEPGLAIESFRQAVTFAPNLPNLHYNLALAYQGTGQIPEAIAAIQQAISLDPKVAVLHAKLGQLLSASGLSKEALPVLRHALLLDSKSISTRLNLAQVLTDLGDFSESESVTRSALYLNPKEPNAHRTMGRIHQIRGEFREASRCFETALELNPSLAAAYFGAAYSKPLTNSDQAFFDRINALLALPGTNLTDRVLLNYSLGKGFDDLGDAQNAMPYFDEANKLSLKAKEACGGRYDPEIEQQKVERIIELFPKEFFSTWKDRGSKVAKPIFIVGMIRSGTTLVEEIISRHSKVKAGGEIRYWTDQEPKLLYDLLADPDAGPKCDDWRLEYEVELSKITTEPVFICDKMPLNYWALGLIHAAYPNAKIIHCRRNALDTCLSIYVTPYRRSPEFAHSWINIASAYEQYRQLMDHWKSVIPGEVLLEADYEELVFNSESSSQRLISFLELEWEVSCLEPTSNSRAVTTPSQWQVRQPIYRTSVNRWKPYEAFLGPIRFLFE